VFSRNIVDFETSSYEFPSLNLSMVNRIAFFPLLFMKLSCPHNIHCIMMLFLIFFFFYILSADLWRSKYIVFCTLIVNYRFMLLAFLFVSFFNGRFILVDNFLWKCRYYWLFYSYLGFSDNCASWFPAPGFGVYQIRVILYFGLCHKLSSYDVIFIGSTGGIFLNDAANVIAPVFKKSYFLSEAL